MHGAETNFFRDSSYFRCKVHLQQGRFEGREGSLQPKLQMPTVTFKQLQRLLSASRSLSVSGRPVQLQELCLVEASVAVVIELSHTIAHLCCAEASIILGGVELGQLTPADAGPGQVV